MKILTWQNPEQRFVAQELINKVKSKCCGIKVKLEYKSFWTELDAKMMAANNFRESYLHHSFSTEEVELSKQTNLKQTKEEKELATQIKSIPQLCTQMQANIDNTELSFAQDEDIEFFAKEHIPKIRNYHPIHD